MKVVGYLVGWLVDYLLTYLLIFLLTYLSVTVSVLQCAPGVRLCRTLHYFFRTLFQSRSDVKKKGVFHCLSST